MSYANLCLRTQESGTPAAGETPASDHDVEVQRVQLEHAVRLWEAEEENARRHFNRIRLLAGLSLAVVGLLINALARLLADANAWPAICFAVAFGVTLLTFGFGYFRLLNPRDANITRHDRSNPTPPATHTLAMDTGEVFPEQDDHPRLTLVEAIEVAKARTHNAAMDLQARNSDARVTLHDNAPWIGLSIAAMAIVLLVAIAIGPFLTDNHGADMKLPGTERHEDQDHGNDQ